jgi:hypothetical protein
MTQDNTQQDTPAQEPTNEHASLEEAIFGGDKTQGSNTNISDVFTTGKQENTTEQAPLGQPQVDSTENAQDNSEVRYQYWQSQADKLKNENDQLKAQQQQLHTMQQQAVTANQQYTQEAQAQPQEEQFPDAPAQPDKPRTFNREEAYNDPSSESAKYLDEVEEWRNDMTQYNTLKVDYSNAVQHERMESMEKQRVDNIKRAQARQQSNQQKSELANYVIAEHGFDRSDAIKFVKTMSDPSSVNIDNLVQLYRMNQGQPAPAAPSGPSTDFQQVQNAQQVPSPMGVMPSGQNNSDNRGIEDKIMDTMIGNFDSKNPWK